MTALRPIISRLAIFLVITLPALFALPPAALANITYDYVGPNFNAGISDSHVNAGDYLTAQITLDLTALPTTAGDNVISGDIISGTLYGGDYSLPVVLNDPDHIYLVENGGVITKWYLASYEFIHGGTNAAVTMYYGSTDPAPTTQEDEFAATKTIGTTIYEADLWVETLPSNKGTWTPAPVPEPSCLILLSLGLTGLAACRKRL